MRPSICALLLAACASAAQAEPHDILARSAPPPPPPPPPPGGPGSSKAGCDVLASILKSNTFFPSTDVYKYENTQFWSNTQLADPACVFRPQSAQDVAAAVKALAAAKSPFALRGGGHMGVPGANNIDAPGVLMVMSNLTGISLNSDKSVLTLQPGFRWSQVYSWLAPHNLVVAGGRLGPVGVPGLLLAGGINFHGNQVGFSADTVLSYEVVLASGKIVTATARDNADLFWALKGGSSNFGIVTSFKLKTIPSKQVWAGTIAYAQDKIGAVYEAIAKYSAAPTDPKAHLVPAVVPSNNKADPDLIVAIVLYDSETESRPACFKDFFEIANVSDSTAFKTVSQFANENGALVFDHINDVFVAGTFAGSNADQLLQGIQITNDTFYTALEDLYANIPASDIKSLQLDWQPISKTWIEAGLKINPAGSPILGGLSEYKRLTYLAYAEVVEWTNESGDHDAFVAQWIQTTTASINKALAKAGLWKPFNYMGDAAGFQDIYHGYGEANYRKLVDISRKYDPARVFQKLMPGGFKLEKLA